jgi:hypothetical protein
MPRIDRDPVRNYGGDLSWLRPGQRQELASHQNAGASQIRPERNRWACDVLVCQTVAGDRDQGSRGKRTEGDTAGGVGYAGVGDNRRLGTVPEAA